MTTINEIDKVPLEQNQIQTGIKHWMTDLFYKITYPFVQFYKFCNYSRIYIQNNVVQVAKDSYNFIVRLFKRCLYTSPFDSRHPNFAELVQNLRIKLPDLKDDIVSFENRFENFSQYLQDLQKLKAISHHINETLDQLPYFIKNVDIHNPSQEIQTDLESLREEYLNCQNKFQEVLEKRTRVILRSFKEIFNILFLMYVQMPVIMQKEFLDHAKIIKEIVVKDGDSNEKKEFLQLFQKLEETPNKDVLTSVHYPLSLRNIGYSCYLDSTLQVLFSIPEIRERLIIPVENPKDPILRKKQKEIREKLINLIQGVPNPSSPLQYLLRITGQHRPLHDVRDVLFRSGLHGELTMPHLHEQLDAASPMELLLDNLVGEKFDVQEVRAIDEIPGKVYYPPQQKAFTFQLAISPKITDLQELINDSFYPHLMNNDVWGVKPKDCIKAKIEEENLELDQEKIIKPKNFWQMFKLESLPKIMCLHIKRFAYEKETSRKYKLNNPIKMPSNGKINLSSIYVGAEKNPKTEYQIMGYVIHEGGIDEGHYVARVKIGEKYYHCNDLGFNPYYEISEEEFYGCEQPYLLMIQQSDATP